MATHFFGGDFFGGEFFSTTPAVVVEPSIVPSGGYPDLQPFEKRDPYRFSREVMRVIETVAVEQVQNLHLDEVQRFEQLERELELQGIEFESQYLEALSRERERLIDLEIGRRLKARIEDQEAMLLILLAANLT